MFNRLNPHFHFFLVSRANNWIYILLLFLICDLSLGYFYGGSSILYCSVDSPVNSIEVNPINVSPSVDPLPEYDNLGKSDADNKKGSSCVEDSPSCCCCKFLDKYLTEKSDQRLEAIKTIVYWATLFIVIYIFNKNNLVSVNRLLFL